MMRTIARMPTRTVGVESFGGLDGQGLPSYSASVDIQARAIQAAEEVIATDGSRIRTTLTLYVAPDQSPLPEEQDRVSVDSESFIVQAREAPKDLRRGEVDHIKALCRDA